MYTGLLFLHSLLRWVVLAAGLFAILKAWQGSRAGAPFTPADKKRNVLFLVACDLQLLVGLVLYLGVSPIAQAALSNMGASMKDRVMRFWAVEHLTLMVLAIALVHIGQTRSRKVEDGRKHKTIAIFFTIAMVAMLAGIPWPFGPVVRPWLTLP